MSPELQVFILDLRQHPLFPQLIAAVERPKLTEYRPSKDEGLEVVGAKHAFASGQLQQHRQWVTLLTGETPSDNGDKRDR